MGSIDRYPDLKNQSNIIWVLFVCAIAWSGIPPAFADDYACEDSGGTHIWTSPRNPLAYRPVRIMAVSTEGPLSELTLIDHREGHSPLPTRRRGGPPWSLTSVVSAAAPGSYRVVASRDGERIACRRLTIGGAESYTGRSTWNPATEAFYSAWIEALFGAPLEVNLSFPSLEPVLRNPERNFLYNHLGLNEDTDLPLTPDCADLPYTLRAYFAWKVGLPIAFRACNRGSARVPPRCAAASIKTEFAHGIRSQTVFRNVTGALINTVHSGSARTGLGDSDTDFYPIPLSRESLWPGTVYADPYGHVLVLVEWVPQSADRPGALLAVDAQPDNSVGRKRFWEGTFLFANTENGGPGFKAFRPLVRTGFGVWRALSNYELLDYPGNAPFSMEQHQLPPDEFYATLTRLINPQGLDPIQAYEATLTALVEQLESRVTSVANGEAYFRRNPGRIIPMPNGAAIFQTTGPWEDYSTPSRDLRLIIAMNVLNGLPNKILRHPELFVLNGRSPEDAAAEVETHHVRRTLELNIVYTRTDGSRWELSVAELLARKVAIEMAYNPNDCPEKRWGARPGTREISTCRRHAPAQQRLQMERYRPWFREARRPAP